MKKSTRILFMVAVTLVLALGGGYTYLMKGGARDIGSEPAAYTITATVLTADFKRDIANSNKLYLNQTIALTGTVSACEGQTITLNEHVICSLQHTSSLKVGQEVKVKGRLIGFDDLMEEIRLDQCSLIQ